MNKKFLLPFLLTTLSIASCSMDGFFNGGEGQSKTDSIQIDKIKVYSDDGKAHVFYTSTENPFAYKNNSFKKLLINNKAPQSYTYDQFKHESGYFDIQLDDYSASNYTFVWMNSNEQKYLKGSTRVVERSSPSGQDTKTLSSIVLSNKVTEYEVGDTFTKPTVTAIYSNGDEENVTNAAVFSNYDMNQAGSYNVSVTYKDKSTSYSITVKAKEVPVTLSRIEVSNVKSEYYVGDAFVKPTVTAIYSNNNSYDVTSLATFSGYNMNAANTYTVNVSYNSVSTTYQITVKSQDDVTYPSGYTNLIWRDEFNGTAVDSSKWDYDYGDGSSIGVWRWGNNEAQWYKPENATVSDGKLHIAGKKESVSGYDYTSCRMVTRGKFSFKYGYIEAKISLPEITGMWPAFWMLPENNVYGGWPHSGEIDILEARGRITNQSTSAIHYSNLNGDHDQKYGGYTFSGGKTLSSYHTYACEWTSTSIKFYVDGYNYLSYSNSDWSTKGAPASTTAPFDQNFHIILNLAIGGDFDGGALPPTSFTSANMKVEYVRVFQK